MRRLVLGNAVAVGLLAVRLFLLAIAELIRWLGGAQAAAPA